MNVRKIPLFRLISMLVSALSMPAFIVPCSAETRSGFWTLVESGTDPRMAQVDFSEFTPFCNSGTGADRCSLSVADVDFSSYRTARSPGGIIDDSALGVALQAWCLSGKTISLDREGLFYLDSMMKKRGLTAPASGYADSCPSTKTIYFIKTSENRSAVMLKVGEYIGGYNRTYYYWGFRPENDRSVFKTALFEQPESLNIIVDVFSGRPNPTFTLKDSAAIAEIVHQIYVSVNTLLDSSVKRSGDLQCSQNLGYRKLTVSGMFGPGDVPNSSYVPTLEICNAGITYYKVSPNSSVMPPRQLYDPNRRLEKLIIRVCCRLGLSVADSYGEVGFCDLIPDSLKDFNNVQPGWRGIHDNGAIEFRRLRGNRIVYSIKQAGRVRVALFDTRGRMIAPIINRYGNTGEHTVMLNLRVMGAGVYLVRVHTAEGMVETAIPLLRH